MSLDRITGFSKTILIISSLLLIARIASLLFADSTYSSDHIAFQLFENCLMIIVVFVPVILDRGVNIRIPRALEIAFVGFCFSGLVLGDLFDFYGRFKWWDILLHGISGVMLGILGYEILPVPSDARKRRRTLYPLFASVWIISFALAVGTMWEIFEYIADGIFGLNTQQYLTSTGTFDESTPLLGRAALRDTMEDLILNFIGAAAVAIFVFMEFRLTSRNVKQDKDYEKDSFNGPRCVGNNFVQGS